MGNDTIAEPTRVVSGRLGFAAADSVIDDDERPGLRRAPTIDDATPYTDAYPPTTVSIQDIRGAEEPPGFVESGFEAVRLPPQPELLGLLREVTDSERMTETQVATLRTLLTGLVIDLGDGGHLRIDHVADEGVFRRSSGPAGLAVFGGEGAARTVHVDQDVLGTPMRQIFDGGAAEVFAHEGPDSRNADSSQYLVNLWLPLRQVTQPLTLMDGRTFDRPVHQLRYRLPTDSFLDRDEDRSVNDIWSCLHDDGQQWWFDSEMGIGDAYVFNTLSAPHGAFALPGEDLLADRHRRIGAVLDAVEAEGDLAAAVASATSARPPLDCATTVPVQDALRRMDDILDGAEEALTSGDAAAREWTAAARQAQLDVVRQSIELRCVASHTAT